VVCLGDNLVEIVGDAALVDQAQELAWTKAAAQVGGRQRGGAVRRRHPQSSALEQPQLGGGRFGDGTAERHPPAPALGEGSTPPGQDAGPHASASQTPRRERPRLPGPGRGPGDVLPAGLGHADVRRLQLVPGGRQPQPRLRLAGPERRPQDAQDEPELAAAEGVDDADAEVAIHRQPREVLAVVRQEARQRLCLTAHEEVHGGERDVAREQRRQHRRGGQHGG
jgi:hypothetical protein